jgi:hypothetical protein
VGNRDGRTQFARVGCCCIWLSGPEFQDFDIWLSGPEFQNLDKRTLLSSSVAAAVFLQRETWVSGPRQTDYLNLYQRTAVPVPPVQGTRKPAGLL